MGKISVDLTGDKELDKALRKLKDEVQRRLVHNALKRSVEPLKEQAKKNIMSQGLMHEGDLHDSIIVGKSKAMNRYEVWVGPHKRKGAHGHLVEFGTAQRQRKKGGSTGAISTPKPFMRPAYNQTEGIMLGLFKGEMKKGIKSFVARNRSKAFRKRKTR